MSNRSLSFAGSPDSNPEIAPFWQRAAEGKLMLRHCNSCQRAHWYPRPICPHCFSADTEWRQAKGTGTIYSFSVMARAEHPYVIAYVTLTEGTTMMTNIVDSDVAAIRIGDPVELVFQATQQGPAVPLFKLA